MEKNNLLYSINSPKDLKKVSIDKLETVSEEVSTLIKDTIQEKGGHYSSPLGVVDLTVALHYVYDSPNDKIIWDVGHQAYPHKILTGRRDNFNTIRQKGGISGFLKRSESEHDVCGAGHSSTSISSALGFAHSRDIRKENNKVVAIIGDGAMTNGLSYEAINNLGFHKTQLTIILNDNSKSISDSVGALSRYLSRMIANPTYNRIRTAVWRTFTRIPFFRNKAKRILRKTEESLKTLMTPGGFFEELGLRYIGPIDGHNIKDMIKLFSNVKSIDTPVLIHVVTKKGKKSDLAEDDSIKYYSLPGKNKSKGDCPSYSKAFGEIVVSAAQEKENFVCITAAMEIGTGLSGFKDKYPTRLFDVGIAEGHALTYASGFSASNIIPVIALYSTFSQRAYDNVFHDLLLQDLPFILCLDRAGLVGEDGPTHHGVLDISMFIAMPNIVISSPKDGNELRDLFHTALLSKKGFVIRYPKGSSISYDPSLKERLLDIGKWEVLKDGENCAILAVGSMVDVVMRDYDMICDKIGFNPTVINARFIKPLDTQMMPDVLGKNNKIITIEEGCEIGGFGSFVLNYANNSNYKGNVKILALSDNFVEQGSRKELLDLSNLNSEKIIELILND